MFVATARRTVARDFDKLDVERLMLNWNVNGSCRTGFRVHLARARQLCGSDSRNSAKGRLRPGIDPLIVDSGPRRDLAVLRDSSPETELSQEQPIAYPVLHGRWIWLSIGSDCVCMW